MRARRAAAWRSTRRGAGELVDAARPAREPEAVAVALLHSYADPAARAAARRAARASCCPGCTCRSPASSSGTFREYERTATTVLDAALSPLLGAYLRRLAPRPPRAGLPEPADHAVLGRPDRLARAAAHAALTVLSGPAGGVGGALLLAELAGERDVLCFDMGGTSCDVCLIDGGRGRARPPSARSPGARWRCRRSTSTRSAPAAARSPGATPAARCASAPSRRAPLPGPACYGRGGERADRHRRQPAARPPARRTRRWRAACGSTARAAERAVAALARELGLETARVRGGDRARRRGRDAAARCA